MLNRIKKLCKEKNIAYKDLSDMTGVSISTIGKIMSEVIKEPSIVTISKIACALNVSLDYLVYGDFIASERTEPEILKKYNTLNSSGKKKADEYITDLSEQKKYTTADEENSNNFLFSPRKIAAYGADGTKQINPPNNSRKIT